MQHVDVLTHQHACVRERDAGSRLGYLDEQRPVDFRGREIQRALSVSLRFSTSEHVIYSTCQHVNVLTRQHACVLTCSIRGRWWVHRILRIGR